MALVSVTTSWDDGHVLDLKMAKLLKKYGLTGTFYVAPEDREHPLEERLSEEQIRELAHEFEIGAHTITHPKLARVSHFEARHEIAQSKSELERITGAPVSSFCYPYGNYNAATTRLVELAGFTYARTCKRYGRSIGSPFAAVTTVHAYRHWSDVVTIAKLAKFNPRKLKAYMTDWSTLAIDLFDDAARRGASYHIWGHSWEVEKNGDWERLERVLKHISETPHKAVTNRDLIASTHPKLLMTAPYFPPAIGGLERYAHEMAKGALRAGYDVVVVTSGFGKTVEITNEDGLKVYRLPVQFRVANTPVSFKWPWVLRSIIRREAPDIINTHAPVPWISDVTTLFAGRTPVLATYHSGTMKKGGRPLFDAIITVYEGTLLHVTLSRAKRIICSSDIVRHHFLFAHKNKTLTINPGVDGKLFSARLSSPHTRRVLFVGNHTHPSKGLSYLQEAVDLVPDCELRVVGEGPVQSIPGTSYLGVMTGKKLVEEFQAADVLVCPSTTTSESFGMVLLEAQACGVPVIGSNIGGIPTVITDEADGLLVPHSNKEALAKAIIRILDNPDLADRLSSSARAKVENSFLWQHQLAKFLGIMGEVRRG